MKKRTDGSRIAIPATHYGARGISPALLSGLIRAVGAVNVSSAELPVEGERLAEAQVHELTAALLAAEDGERFSVGPNELIALRFVLDGSGRALTLLAVEDYERAFPCLVDGHVTDRDRAIAAWLGDADATDHPTLYLRS